LPSPSDLAALGDVLLPLKIAFGILLGYLLLDYFHDKFPPHDPDGYV
jgi:hypothetical protein